MNINTAVQISEFNNLFKDRIIFDCEHYQRYNTFNFLNDICLEQQNYVCCFKIKTVDALNNTIFKNQHIYLQDDKLFGLPIMLGSDIDAQIRHDLEPQHLGVFLLDGQLKKIPNFLANHLNEGHLQSNGEKKSFNFTYNDDLEKFIFSFDPSKEKNFSLIKVTTLIKHEKKMGIMKNYIKEDITEDAEKIITKYFNIDFDFFKNYLNAAYNCAPTLDLLENKLIVSPSSTLHRALTIAEETFNINFIKTGQLKFDNPKKITLSLCTGNFFYAISKKSDLYNLKDNYGSVMFNTIDGHKSDLVELLNGTTSRYVQHQLKNSRALNYQKDFEDFIDPISVSISSEPGKSVVLSHLVFLSPKIDEKKIIKHIIDEYHNDNKKLFVVWKGIPTKYKINNEDIISIKRKCIFISIRIYENFILFLTQNNRIMRFSTKYGIGITPWEKIHYWKDAFIMDGLRSKFSPLTNDFPIDFVTAHPPKLSVSIANKKGACGVFNSTLSASLAPHYLGNDAYLTFDSWPNERVKKLIFNFYKKPQEIYFVEPDSLLFENLVCDVDVPKSFEIIKKTRTQQENTETLNYSSFLHNYTECIKVLKQNLSLSPKLEFFSGEIVQKQINLFTVIRDLHGATNEDGVVISHALKNSNLRILQSTTVKNINFEKFLPNGKTISIDENDNVKFIEMNCAIECKIIFGRITSHQKLKINITNKNRVKSEEIYYNSIWCYEIFSEEIIPADFIIESFFFKFKLNVHYRFTQKLDIGIKIASTDGQKCNIAAIEDLGFAVNEFGHQVPVHVAFSLTNLVGRKSNPHLREILRAANTPGKLYLQNDVVPVISRPFYIHKTMNVCKKSNPRIDIMKCFNGFLPNNLTNFYNCCKKNVDGSIGIKNLLQLNGIDITL